MDSEWLTTSEAADLLACSENWLQHNRNLVRDAVARQRDGKRWLWRRDDCVRLIAIRRKCGGQLHTAARVMLHARSLD